jgi:hypothetical protein
MTLVFYSAESANPLSERSTAFRPLRLAIENPFQVFSGNEPAVLYNIFDETAFRFGAKLFNRKKKKRNSDAEFPVERGSFAVELFPDDIFLFFCVDDAAEVKIGQGRFFPFRHASEHDGAYNRAFQHSGKRCEEDFGELPLRAIQREDGVPDKDVIAVEREDVISPPSLSANDPKLFQRGQRLQCRARLHSGNTPHFAAGAAGRRIQQRPQHRHVRP